MEDRKLTGNKMFEMVKEECERGLGKTNNLQKQQRGVLFQRKVNGKWSWHQRGNEEKDLKYVGEIKNGKPEGDGIWTSHNGDSFSGEWKNGKEHGQGTMIWNDGSKYIGEWKYGDLDGFGNFYFADGSKYEGEFKKGKKSGQGIYTYKRGDIYEGEWKQGKNHGKGTYTYSLRTKENCSFHH